MLCTNISAASVYTQDCTVLGTINIANQLTVNSLTLTDCTLINMNCDTLTVSTLSYTNTIAVQDDITVTNATFMSQILCNGLLADTAPGYSSLPINGILCSRRRSSGKLS